MYSSIVTSFKETSMSQRIRDERVECGCCERRSELGAIVENELRCPNCQNDFSKFFERVRTVSAPTRRLHAVAK